MAERDTVMREVHNGKVVLPVLDCGEGPVVLLLHGFPDSHRLWRNQIPALIDAGFRVLAPDLRGFGAASKPANVDAYQLPVIVEDVLAILNTLHVTEVMVVGHDWGASVGWLLAAYHPQRVLRLVSLGVGCPGTSGLRTIEQRERFWFFYFFQFKGIAEQWLQYDDWKLFREWTRGDGDLEHYISELARPGALTAALNWYRANVRPEPPGDHSEPFPLITCPVLGIWSDGDNYLTEGHLLHSSEKISGSWHYERLRGASHWMMLDKPAELNQLLVPFLRAH